MTRRATAMLFLATLSCAAQSPRYDVAVIKPNKTGSEESSVQPGVHGTLRARNATLASLVQAAYGVPSWRVSGASGWIANEHFDIDAKSIAPDASYSYEQTLDMMQELLRDRFRLAAHHETRDMPIFALVVARSGLKMPEAKADCLEITPNTTLADLGSRAPCGSLRRIDRGHFTGARISSLTLAKSLEGLGRVVVDDTRLEGRFFDIDLTWTPGELDAATPDTSTSGPSIFTAIETQLGLKLEPRRGPVDIVVIDRAERPTDN